MPEEPNAPAVSGPDNSIVTFLQFQRGGGAMDDLSAALRRVMGAVKSTRKKGKIVLEIEVHPTAGSHLEFYDTVTAKAPQEPRECGVFFLGDAGELTRQDPRQREFRFGSLPGGKVEVPAPVQAVASGE